jgi:hypothetical protein
MTPLAALILLPSEPGDIQENTEQLNIAILLHDYALSLA